MVMLLLAQGTVPAVPVPPGWNRYANVRYGYVTCYPRTMRAHREADNGDGRRFTAADGGRIAVWGSNNFDGSSLIARMRMSLRRDEIVTYGASKPGWIVQSGTQGNRIFWRKMYRRGEQFVGIDISYPAVRKAAYAPVVRAISACFKVGAPAY